MPKKKRPGRYTWEPLTQQEREQIENKINKTIEAIDEYCFEKNIPFDKNKVIKDTMAKVNDDHEIIKLRLAQDIEEMEKIQTEKVRALSTKYPIPENRNYLASSIKFLLKTDGSRESEKYNDELYKNYAENPEKFTHVRIKNLLNYDSKEAIEAGKDDASALVFYRDNRAICMEAQAIQSLINKQGLGTIKSLRDAAPTISSIAEKLNQPAVIYDECKSLDHFTVPQVDKVMADKLIKNTKEILGKGAKINKVELANLSRLRGDKDKQLSLNDLANKMQEKGLPFEKGVFMQYQAYETNPETGEKKHVSIEDYLNNKPNVTVEQTSTNDYQRMNHVSKLSHLEYNKDFQRRMGEKLGETYNIFKVAKENRGGFFERKLGKTSNEYKEFIDALADYSNPEKPGYLDRDNLKAKTVAYLEHTEEDRPELNETNATRRGRRSLAQNTFNVLREMEEDHTNIMININRGINNDVPYAFIPAREAAIEDNNIVNEDDSFFVEEDKKSLHREGLINIEVNNFEKEDNDLEK